jgi:hypothetical protein
MIKVYVAGAYSDTNVLGVLKNIGRGEYWAAKLFMEGFAPFTPWHDKEFVIQHWDKDFTVKMFYDYSMEWLRVSDVVFIIPNHEGLRNWQDSNGTLDEIGEAKRLNKPIFYTLADLLAWKETKKLIIS